VNPLLQIKQIISKSTSPEGMQTRIVAIDGCGGAGKSSLAAKLAALLDDCPLIHTDDFASWDHPLDWYPRMITQVVEPCPVVLVEGVSASRVEFRPYLSFAIFVETDRELRLQRGLERDGEEALPLWQQWMAEEDEYLLRDRPKEYADVVISGNTGDLWRIKSSC
jgi:uridine kinase